MKKGNVESVKGGFSVKPTTEYTEKQEREARMIERKVNSPTNPTIKDSYELQMDIAARQEEIYNMLKSKRV